jgi:hypothetical protein
MLMIRARSSISHFQFSHSPFDAILSSTKAWEDIVPTKFDMSKRQAHLFNTPGSQSPDGVPVGLSAVPGFEFDSRAYAVKRIDIDTVDVPVPRSELLNQAPNDHVCVSHFDVDVEENDSKLAVFEWR